MMKRVKEYLDERMFNDGATTIELKKNGHYNVQGCWNYPHDWMHKSKFDDFVKLSLEEQKSYKAPDHISVTINNETVIVGNMSVNGIWSRYHYLQTYEHIPRGEPDDNGYYMQSTEEEIIKYIDEFYQKIKLNESTQL